MIEWPKEVEIDGTMYTLRMYTPKRKGETAGHGWLRVVDVGRPYEHRSEVPGPMVALIDEIVRLRALCDGRAAEILRLSDEIENCRGTIHG